jgi:hypothetical protein
MIDVHLIHMFLAGFGIAAGSAVLLTGVIVAGAALLRRDGVRRRLMSLNPLNPFEVPSAMRRPPMLGSARTRSTERESAGSEQVSSREPALR